MRWHFSHLKGTEWAWKFTFLWWYGEGGGFRMGITCIPVADSFWYLAKLIQLRKVLKKSTEEYPLFTHRDTLLCVGCCFIHMRVQKQDRTPTLRVCKPQWDKWKESIFPTKTTKSSPSPSSHLCAVFVQDFRLTLFLITSTHTQIHDVYSQCRDLSTFLTIYLLITAALHPSFLLG